ncbi:LOW QUALITY PROTEIN: hypothetical protein Cgig2_027476 [Carnegiea gigantea]|uniref:Uncharacterized protein n=1 Tax=Carnegiea gigantea TaxID=171969 RepID=A0A9Q1KPG4_9CARY|nr:LOW QUALITY PROTEIN: hypothetical protein Cgig2_027476 [Carnegiea gigantea]
MVFDGKAASQCASPHNNPLVVEMKIASIIVQGSSIDIITWDCLKKLVHPGRDIVPLVHPILGFGGQEVNSTGMIRLPVRFDNKLRSKNLEVNFLVVDVPTAYNVILRHPTLHKYILPKKNKQYHKKTTRKKKRLHIRLSTILMTLLLRSPGLSIHGVGCLVPCTLALTERGNKLHLLGVTTFIFGLLTVVHVGEPRNSYPPKTLGPASPKPCVNTLGYQCGPAGSLAPSPGPPFLPLWLRHPQPSQAPPLAGAASFSCRLHGRPDQPSAFPNAAGTDIPPQLSIPNKYLGHGYLLLGDLWGIQSTRGDEVLTRENLAARSALMKLVDDHCVIRGELPATWGATLTVFSGAVSSYKPVVRSPDDRLLYCRVADRLPPASPA